MRDVGAMDISSRLPAVLSWDVVGTVISNGPNAALPIGSRVFSQANVLTWDAIPRETAESFSAESRIFSQVSVKNALGGGLQEYTTLKARNVSQVPSNISDVEASTLPVNSFTSGVSLFGSAGLNIPLPGTPESDGFDYTSKKLVIIGGGTNCGKLGIQFASIARIGTIIATASSSSAEELKGYGATHVIDRRASNVKEQIRAIVGDELIYVYDTINVGDYSLAVSILSNSKRGTLLRLIPGEAKIQDAVEAAKSQGWEDKVIFGTPVAYPEFADIFHKAFVSWLEQGLIKPPKYNIIEGLNADEINKAIDDIRDGRGYKPAVKI